MELLVLNGCVIPSLTLVVYEVHVMVESPHLLLPPRHLVRHLRLVPPLVRHRFAPLLVVLVLRLQQRVPLLGRVEVFVVVAIAENLWVEDVGDVVGGAEIRMESTSWGCYS